MILPSVTAGVASEAAAAAYELMISSKPVKGFLNVKNDSLVSGSTEDATVSFDTGTVDAGNLNGLDPETAGLELTTFSIRYVYKAPEFYGVYNSTS